MSTQNILLFFIIFVIIFLLAWLYWANKKMLDKGIHDELNKKMKKKKNKEKWYLE